MVLSTHKTEESCRWRRRKEARPDEILDAALALFAARGFAATRMCDVARRAGISKGTLYLYFDSKEAIFREVVRRKIEPQISHYESVFDHHPGSMAELIETMIRGCWGNLCDSNLSAIPKLIVSESGNFPELAAYFTTHVVKRARKLFANAVREGIARGEFRECDPETMARLIVAPQVHTAIWQHSLRTYDDDINMQQFIDHHIEMILRGIKQEAGSRK